MTILWTTIQSVTVYPQYIANGTHQQQFLAGDGLFIISQLSLVGLKPIVSQRFNEIALEVCEGQGIDKQFENDNSITMEQYIVMIGKKTASFRGMC